MFKRVEGSGKIVGVLSDFDLASLQGDKSRNSERTGTLPFMARELLGPKGLSGQIQHEYRHDAESFFWVAFIDTALYPNGSLKNANEDYARNILQCVDGKMTSSTLLDFKRARMVATDKHIPTEEQQICWEGFRGIALIWRIRDIEADPLLGIKVDAPPSGDPKSLYDWHVAIRKSHEEKLAINDL